MILVFAVFSASLPPIKASWDNFLGRNKIKERDKPVLLKAKSNLKMFKSVSELLMCGSVSRTTTVWWTTESSAVCGVSAVF